MPRRKDRNRVELSTIVLHTTLRLSITCTGDTFGPTQSHYVSRLTRKNRLGNPDRLRPVARVRSDYG
jgi:hypothetical protein